MTKIIKKQIDNFEQIEKKLFWSFSVLVFLLIVSYGVLVNKTILNGKYNQDLNEQISSISQNLNNLEFKYLESKNNITLNLALSKGFILVSDQKFVERGSTENSLSLISNEK